MYAKSNEDNAVTLSMSICPSFSLRANNDPVIILYCGSFTSHYPILFPSG